MTRYFLVLISCIFFQSTSFSQLAYFSPEAMEGYTLFSGSRLYLVNNCGEVINDWISPNPQYHVKLLPNGNIIYIEWVSNKVIERDWNDNVVNQVTLTEPGLDLDYEVIVLENGNYLCVARKHFSFEDFENIGYNLDQNGNPNLVDAVLELDRNSGEVVWQWFISDHVIQERSDTLPNYGIVNDHPELLDMDAISKFDWQDGETFMINGMDYNSALDQIVLSIRKLGEIAIIDHSTTTAEAAGHSGGSSGKGGDILYRWGNPQNYGRGDENDQQLFYQHNPNWIEHGEHVGKIAIFNNGLNRTNVAWEDRYSNAPIITPPIQSDGNYTLHDILAFEPATPVENYGLPGSDIHFYSNYTSAHKILPNGNILITAGDDDNVIELKPDGTKVWEYHLASSFFTFRAEKYATDYPAFENRDLTPGETIEFPSSSVACDLQSSTTNQSENFAKAWVDVHSRKLFIQTDNPGELEFALYDLLGRKSQQLSSIESWNNVGDATFSYSLPAQIGGLYILNIRGKKEGGQQSIKLFIP